MGQGDWYNFNHLISDFKNNLFGEKTNREFLDFLYSGFRIEYEKEVNALKDFIKELNKIVESQSEIVLNDYDSNRETTHYSFIIASNDLDVLSEEVYKIMEENDFVDVLDNATQRVMNKIVKQYL
ncbi:hypothetical protein [Aquimarina macrocephali]|uniref:hypothetical protein n=1 Tax=Aquimarina macrocephali TaxID=666563 RepID=UPI000463A192|nr:hypothetical protein [Aquimarina macrocephali]